MQVIKRNGEHELISFDKITKRITDLCGGLAFVDPLLIAKETINGIYNGIKTIELDTLSADICASKSHHHPEYNKIGGRILSSNITKTTSDSYLDVVNELHTAGILSDAFHAFVECHHVALQEMIDYRRDELFDYFAMKTLERSYLFKINGRIVERPQHMWMRVAIQVNGLVDAGKDASVESVLQNIKDTYTLTSTLYFTHATPTLFNSGTPKPQLSSCFLLSSEDNIEDIFKTIADIAKISKWAGGIGLSLSNIRAKGSVIRGTNGKSEGIIPLCKTLETVGRYINQGGKRQGSISVYLEPWHADIYSFIELRKNTGDENLRARDLFLALWIPDIFMKRIEQDGDWTLMCPNECSGLVDSYGETFEKRYLSYEQDNKGKKTVKARDLWNHILESQIETGMPYVSYKDTVNQRNMQQHLGVIRNSNLCVTGDTQILTDQGYVRAGQNVGQLIRVWNGEEWSETTIFKTGEDKEIITVVLSNGSELSCTPYHTFYVYKETTQVTKLFIDVSKKLVKVKACELVEGDTLIPFNFPVISESTGIQTPECDEEEIPFHENLKTRLRYVEEVLNRIGFVDNHGYQLSSPDRDYLEGLKRLLQTMGCQPHTKTAASPFTLYIMSLTDKDMNTLCEMGCRPKMLDVHPLSLDADEMQNRPVTVKGIIRTDRREDTYCFTEEKRGMGVFNGILTGQCNEIALVSNKDNIAVCNLASICLPRFVENGVFNFEKLRYVAGIACRNLNAVIDVNYYPTPETWTTNRDNRPIGIGIQGLADVYCMMGYPFGSEEARQLNRQISENMYYGAVAKSIALAKEHGPYPHYEGSPHSQGLFQFDMLPEERGQTVSLSLDWQTLRADMALYGIRNSLLTALMPTASTSQIMCNNECFEPYTSNIYVRKTLAGEFTVVNHHLITELIRRGIWNQQVYEEILYDNGSVQKVKCIPDDVKAIYKTAFELKITDLLKQAVDRGPFVDHMQSMNLFMAKPDFNLLNSSHFYSWKNGLKTGMYYLRTQPAVDAVKFGLDPSSIQRIKSDRKQILKDAGVVDGACPKDTYLRSICESCSS